MCELCQPEKCGNCGSELKLCPVCEYQVCSSEPEHIDHFLTDSQLEIKEKLKVVRERVANDVTKICSCCGEPYKEVSEGHDYVKCVQDLYDREKHLQALLKRNGGAIIKALGLRDKQVHGEINTEFNFGGPIC